MNKKSKLFALVEVKLWGWYDNLKEAEEEKEMVNPTEVRDNNEYIILSEKEALKYGFERSKQQI